MRRVKRRGSDSPQRRGALAREGKKKKEEREREAPWGRRQAGSASPKQTIAARVLRERGDPQVLAYIKPGQKH